MVRWDADKNAYITGAVLAELKMTISNQIVQAVLDGWRKLIFPCCFCFEFSCDPFACLIFCIVFLMFGFGLSCTLFLRVLFSPALVLHFCLGFMDLILRVLSLRLRFLGCVFITACICCFLLRFTSYLPHLLYCYFLLSFHSSPSFFPFHQKHTIPNLLLLRNSNFQTRRSTHPPRPKRSSQETLLLDFFHHHCCQESRS